MDITEVSIILHVGVVLLSLWLLNNFNCCHPLAYFFSLIYLYLVHERYSMRFRRKVQFEERRQANQKRVLSDSESVRWLNHAVERIWPVCLEQIVSQKILLPIIPWFLQKYKPWTVRDSVVQHLYMGRSAPMFTGMRVLHQSTGDDHLVLELGLNFRTADDMSAILAVKLTKRLGFGMWAKMHLTGMHVEGKILVGVKFLHKWPFLSRLRVCFVEPPYFQMTVKPIFAHGLDVTELPGIAGWLDKLLSDVFEETLVEPNMLVVDVEKFVSPEAERWFSVDAKEPVAYTLVEVIEASDMKPSDLNGLADPYVKGQLGAYRFRTKTKKKTLSPKWHEEFKIPICTWESPNLLNIDVRDKDHFVDDALGDCSINISDFRGGQRHDIWLPLQNIKMGRLHLAISVLESIGKGTEQPYDGETLDNEYKRNSFGSDTTKQDSFLGEPSEKPPETADNFEPIDIEGHSETGIWVHHPGAEVPQKWEARKGKNRLLDVHAQEGGDSGKSSVLGSYQNDTSSTDESMEDQNTNTTKNSVRRGLRMISSIFHRSPRMENDKFGSLDKSEPCKSCSLNEPIPSPYPNLRSVNQKGISVHFVIEDNLSPASAKSPTEEGRESSEGTRPESPNKKNVTGMAKSILKHAGKSARSMKHALSHRGSRQFRGESEPALTERDLSVESDTSCEESLPSPVQKPEVEVSAVVPIPVSGPANDSLKSEDGLVQTNLNEPAMDSVAPTDTVSVVNDSKVPATTIVEPTYKVSIVNDSEGPATTIVGPVDEVEVDSLEKRAHDSSDSSQQNGDRLVESKAPSLPSDIVMQNEAVM